jgi:tryptophan halogenase
MLQQYIKSPKILIVGGGAAGYLTALYVNKLYPNTDITLVEDPNSPPIQVGESGNVLFTQALRFLEIDFADWSQKTENLIKLGGILDNWKGDGSSWFHARVSHYQSLMTDRQTNLEYLKGLLTSNIPIYKTLLHGYAFDNKVVPYAENKLHICPSMMYHFDSRKNVEYLKSVAVKRKINVIFGKVLHQNKSETGTIDSVMLDNNITIDCDWVFDCSGLSKSILKKNYDVEYIDLSKYFLARSVITWLEEENINHKFATDIIARNYGWQWSIDTRYRRGNGYVYSKDFISEDTAINEIESVLNKKIKIQANFDWDIEYANKVSKKNVIAVGLSAGFLEPLEANGILLIIQTLNSVKDYWSPTDQKIDNDQINFSVNNSIIEIVEFLTMHYQCDRNNTDFWKEFKSDNYTLPYNLKNILIDLEEFITTDKKYLDFDYSVYSIESWLMVLQSTKNFNIKKENLHSIENLNRITRQYSSLLDKASSLEQWVSYVSANK